MSDDGGEPERDLRAAAGCPIPRDPHRPSVLRTLLMALCRRTQALRLASHHWRAREQHLQLALRLARLSTWEWDIDSGQVRWSPEPQVADGLPRGSMNGTLAWFLDLVHPDDRDRMRRTLDLAARDGSSFEAEFRIVLADGRVRWRTAAGDVMRDWAGRPTTVIAVGRDVTERKQAAERLLLAEGRYRTLVEQLPLASYVEHLDQESATYMSPQIADLVGYTAEEWVADSNFFARVLHPEDRQRVLAGFAAMHGSGASFECEYRLVAPDGRIVWIHDAAVVVRDQDGRPLYAQGYMIDISERKRNEAALRESRERLQQQMEKAEHQALHDGLTGLPNRTLFRDRAQQAVVRSNRDGSGFAVMLIDLDRFKEVNDTLGHHSGDLLLREVAERLRRALRKSDTVARLGGDEFGVITPGLCDAAAARALADKLRDELAQPIVVGGLAIEVEASVGIAIFPEHGQDVETLIRHADVSMYVSKNTHTPIVYAAAYDHHSLARLALVGELRRAVDSNELVVHYQPQADIASGEVRKAEALVRWQHPQHGLLGPDQFIPLAEQTGLIRSLTRYVLDAALAQWRAWRDEGRQLGVAVNITTRELIDLRFPDEVAELLAKWRVEPGQLELEITETSLMTDPPRARSILARLRGLGVRFAIDDFGTGHSSFNYLKQLPIDILKIDKSFVQRMGEDVGDAAIVRSAIDVGHALGLEIVAEGVEDEQAKRRLEELGCDAFQGYHLGRPQPAGALHEDAGRGPVTRATAGSGSTSRMGR
jgi:diguanylate cyclase (GGDEF)-like protein/PAS domain S-box-containing protein